MTNHAVSQRKKTDEGLVSNYLLLLLIMIVIKLWSDCRRMFLSVSGIVLCITIPVAPRGKELTVLHSNSSFEILTESPS